MFLGRVWPLRSILLAAILVAALAGAYAFSLRGDFLWDDDLHITANPTIIGPLGLKEIWTTARANYFPLVLTNFWAQHAWWGLEPFGYRIVTLAFHMLSALLLWQVLRKLHVPGAWLGAALWALHPVQVESVAWICELKNTQSAAFFLAAILAWVRWFGPSPRTGRSPRMENASGAHETGSSLEERQLRGAAAFPGRPPASRGWYILALAFAALAILSKPSTVMLPPVLVLCAWWIRRRFLMRDVLWLAPFFALSGLAAGWTIWEQKFHSGAIGPEWSQTIVERVGIAGRAIWFYLGKLLWPEPLVFIYPRWDPGILQPAAIAAPLAAAAGLLLLWRGRNGRLGPLFFAAACFVALLFPVLGFFSVYFFRYSFVGDHFQYLASMAPLALAGAGLTRIAGRFATAPAAVLLVALGLATMRQSRAYLNNEALWRHTVAHNPAAVMAWLNLADTLARAERYDEAIATFQHALKLRPDDPHAHNDLGNLLVLISRPADALPHFERALAVKPDMADAASNFGNALRDLGRVDEALAQFRRALGLQPDHASALNNLGAELAQMGRAAEALPLLERARGIKPADAGIHDNLAGALRELGRHEEAIAAHGEAIRLKPAFAEAHANLGRTLVVSGRLEAAQRAFERALDLKPSLVPARSQYAGVLVSLGRGDEAFAQLQRAVELAPDSAEAHQNLGAALAQSGRPETAVASFERAVQLQPGFAAAHANLGTAYLALQRWGDAVRQLEQAVGLQPENAAMRAQLAVALVNSGRLEEAVPQFERAIQLAPDVAETHDNFGQLLNALGRRREAFEHLEEGARLRREKGR